MFFEILLGASFAAAAAYGLRTLRDMHENRGMDARDEEDAGDDTPPATTATPVRNGPRGLKVGDVLLLGNDELWLAGMIELQEEGEFIARVFHAPGAVHPWVVQLDDEGRELLLGDQDRERKIPVGRVPDELPYQGLRVILRRRGKAQITTRGEHLPPTRPTADFAILRGRASPGAVMVVDFEAGERLGLIGEVVDRAMIELLPGGDDE